MGVISDKLQYLQVKNLYFKTAGGITTIINAVDITQTYCEVTTGNNLPESGFLVLQTSVFEYVIKVTINKNENGIYRLNYNQELNKVLLTRLIQLDNLKNKTNQRKEERYDVGLNNSDKFGLASPECYLLLQSGKVKCIISNASIHGVLLIGERSFLKIGESVFFFSKFKNNLSVKQSGIVIAAENIKLNYFRYSLNFIEPISVVWQEKIISYSEALLNEPINSY